MRPGGGWAAPPKGLQPKLRTLRLRTYYGLAWNCSRGRLLGQGQLTHLNPDLRVTSIDQQGAPIPAVRGIEIERQGSTLSGPSAPEDEIETSATPDFPKLGYAAYDRQCKPIGADLPHGENTSAGEREPHALLP